MQRKIVYYLPAMKIIALLLFLGMANFIFADDELYQHEHPQPADPSQESHQHAAHDMNHASYATINGGPYRSMHEIGSGTSLQPASSPMPAWHFNPDDWMLMVHGDLKITYNNQGDPRGVDKFEAEDWVMIMAEHSAGPGSLMLRGMFSGEPWTTPDGGFPQLFQTGELFEGRPIVDAQHPHDLFMELAASYSLAFSDLFAINIYGGPVGEPALGPVAFMHRVSAAENPTAPLAHHLQDVTHITHGVITAGVTAGLFRIEGSVFHGAEPDENRTDIEMGKLDSWSSRLWYTPTKDWALQVSYGHLADPEAIEPGDINRTTASISYNRSWLDGNWATTLIWGHNQEEHHTLNSYLLESTVNFFQKNYFYTRLELADKTDVLFEENIFGKPGLTVRPPELDEPLRVGAFTFGGVRDVFAHPKFIAGIGGDFTFYHVPGSLESVYGSNPTSFHIFLRFRPSVVHH
jgi:hypothetical protein